MEKLNSVWGERPEEYADLRDNHLNRRRYNYLLPFVSKAQRVLELGSGTGGLLSELARQFPHKDFIGVEPLKSYVQYCKRTYRGFSNLRFVCQYAESVEEIQISDCDLILSNDVLHHIDGWETLCQNLSRISRKGCLWMAIEPNARNPYAFLGQSIKSGERNFHPKTFTKIAEQWGFRLLERNYLFIIPPFFKRPPILLQKLENFLEGNSILSGGVVLQLVKV